MKTDDTFGQCEAVGNDKPSLEIVQEDIDKKQALILINHACIYGVSAFIIGDDPTYQVIESGSWLNDAPYGTIHRIAANGQANKIFATALAFCESKISNIRIDTHTDNQIMQYFPRCFFNCSQTATSLHLVSVQERCATGFLHQDRRQSLCF